MGKQPYQIKREKRERAERMVKGDGYRDDAGAETVAAFQEATHKRHHKASSSGGFIPSAKHVEGGMLVKRYDGSGRSSYGHEGSERMDTSRAPLMRESYRAPSLSSVRQPARPAIQPDVSRVGTGPSIIGNDTRVNRSAFAEGVERDRRAILATGFIRRPADPDGRTLWEAGKRLATEPD